MRNKSQTSTKDFFCLLEGGLKTNVSLLMFRAELVVSDREVKSGCLIRPAPHGGRRSPLGFIKDIGHRNAFCCNQSAFLERRETEENSCQEIILLI